MIELRALFPAANQVPLVMPSAVTARILDDYHSTTAPPTSSKPSPAVIMCTSVRVSSGLITSFLVLEMCPHPSEAGLSWWMLTSLLGIQPWRKWRCQNYPEFTISSSPIPWHLGLLPDIFSGRKPVYLWVPQLPTCLFGSFEMPLLCPCLAWYSQSICWCRGLNLGFQFNRFWAV